MLFANTCFWFISDLFYSIAFPDDSYAESSSDTCTEADFRAGFISGTLPVLALQLLLWLLFKLMQKCATKYICLKNMYQVISYTLFWHLIYQFVNLFWVAFGFVLLPFVETWPFAFVFPVGQEWATDYLSENIPATSVYFFSSVIWGSFLMFGWEISLLYSVVADCFCNVKQREPRSDANKEPLTINWGQALPPHLLMFCVILVYMPLAPLIGIFSMVYFGGWYLIWKHNCLHVYTPEFEGGGRIWEACASFIMFSLYLAELALVGYLLIKVSAYSCSVASH